MSRRSAEHWLLDAAIYAQDGEVMKCLKAIRRAIAALRRKKKTTA